MSTGLSGLQLTALCVAGLALFGGVTYIVGCAIATMNPIDEDDWPSDDDDAPTAFAGCPEPRWLWPLYLAAIGAAAGVSALWPLGWAA